MLTYISYERMENALRCFLRQTYPNKELVIVANGSDVYTEMIAKIVAENKAEKLVKIYDIRNNYGTLADMRNLALWFCNGEFVCLWDDDDEYGDKRIEKQVECLKRNRDKFYTIFGNCTYFSEGFSQREITGANLKGSMLFRNKPKDEDLFMGDYDEYQKFAKKDGIVLKNDPKDYIFVKHKLNVRDNTFFADLIRNNESLIDKFKKSKK